MDVAFAVIRQLAGLRAARERERLGLKPGEPWRCVVKLAHQGACGRCGGCREMGATPPPPNTEQGRDR